MPTGGLSKIACGYAVETRSLLQHKAFPCFVENHFAAVSGIPPYTSPL